MRPRRNCERRVLPHRCTAVQRVFRRQRVEIPRRRVRALLEPRCGCTALVLDYRRVGVDGERATTGRTYDGNGRRTDGNGGGVAAVRDGGTGGGAGRGVGTDGGRDVNNDGGDVGDGERDIGTEGGTDAGTGGRDVGTTDAGTGGRDIGTDGGTDAGTGGRDTGTGGRDAGPSGRDAGRAASDTAGDGVVVPSAGGVLARG